MSVEHSAEAKRVRERLDQLRITQREIAELLNLSQPAVSRRLTGEVPFRFGELRKIAARYSIPLDELAPEAETSAA